MIYGLKAVFLFVIYHNNMSSDSSSCYSYVEEFFIIAYCYFETRTLPARPSRAILRGVATKGHNLIRGKRELLKITL